MEAGNPLNRELKQVILAIDDVTDVITKRQSLHANYRANRIENAGSSTRSACSLISGSTRANTFDKISSKRKAENPQFIGIPEKLVQMGHFPCITGA